MNVNYPYWLSKEIVSGIKRFDLDAYFVALEGWRRGLHLKFYYELPIESSMKIIGFNTSTKIFSLSNQNKTHFFYRSRGDIVPASAVELGTDKHETKQILSEKGIKVPMGKRFKQMDSDRSILKAALKMGFPLVAKPTFGSLGIGVITNIQTKQELNEAIHYIRSELGYQDLIIEQYISGDDLRVYVVGNKVLGAVKRVPAHVIGDGKQSISKLIEQKNDIRRKNPHLVTRLITINKDLVDFIEQNGYSLESVPKKDEIVYLNGKANISAGGDAIDVTDSLRASTLQTAINGVMSIPGLEHAGIDLIESDGEAYVIEINPTAGIALHTFPSIGEPRNIAEGIIDFYFPETIGMAKESNRIYFDYKNISELLRSKSIKEVVVTEAPKGQLYAKRYVISGKVQKVGYRNWIRNQAIEHGLHGYTRNLNNGKVVVVVGSMDKQSVDSFKEVCYRGPERAVVEDIQEYVWENQLRVGFEIKNTRK